MIKKILFASVCAAMIFGCGQNPKNTEVITLEPEIQEPVEPEPISVDLAINSAARFFAGIDTTGMDLSLAQKAGWESYVKSMESMKAKSKATLHVIDSIAEADMTDIRNNTQTVFYPFSGPDFLYPITFFPSADNYYLVGLEPAGEILDKIPSEIAFFNSYINTLKVFLNSSFFRTLSMKEDLNGKGETIDGTAPVIASLMAMMGYEIHSAQYKALNEAGELIDNSTPSDIVEFEFFKEGTSKLQRLVYFSTNLKTPYNDPKFFAFAEKLDKKTTASYLKSASYLMHKDGFFEIRDIILDHSSAVVEDDSGIPYRDFAPDKWDITLYGKYVKPISIFDDQKFQKDLDAAYKSSDIKSLPVRIGYNRTSNLLVARSK